ncbi:MAG TPA: hypothetical protein VJK52_04335, partial [Candidatus Nanoarchaeia archaeon]|nr:hypothetical protein [Candidatus Nanoarchaeia archaeon]
IQYGDRRILLLNNCGFGCQRELAAEDLRADVLQLAQQGREEANSDKLFDQIRPSIAIASVGVNNAERLPRKDLMQNLNQRRIKLYRTDVQYTISLVTNGKTLDVESEVPYRLERI